MYAVDEEIDPEIELQLFFCAEQCEECQKLLAFTLVVETDELLFDGAGVGGVVLEGSLEASFQQQVF